MASAIKIISLVQTIQMLYKRSFNFVHVRTIFELIMDSSKPKHQHVNRTLKEKMEILKHVG